MKRLLILLSKITIYFTRFAMRMAWQHRAVMSYGITMFLLGIWAAGGFDKTADRGGDMLQAESGEKRSVVSETKNTEINKQQDLIRSLSSSANEVKKISGGREDDLSSVEVVIGKGDTFLNKLVASGVKWSDAYATSDALKGVYNLRSLKLGQKMEILFSAEGGGEKKYQILKIEKPDTVISVVRGTDGTFSATEDGKVLISKKVRAGGEIHSSLFQLAAELGIPNAIVMESIRAYSYDVDFQRDVRAGSRYEVMYEIIYDDRGNRIRSGDLIFAALTIGGKEMKIFRYVAADGDESFYTSDGRSVRRALLKTPISGARISSRYGMRRHPIKKYSKMHKGVDFAAPKGTPIYAAGKGTIERAGRYGAYGKYIRIRHNSTYSTAYAHLNGYAKGMKKGKKVKQGQVIGYVGTTGRSTGPHLHYETIVSGKQRNPLTLKMTPGKKLSNAELDSFKKNKYEIETLLASLPIATQLASTE